jgi:hypothetical protein
MNYLKQKATPWVSISVLVGGLAAAVILFFLVNVQNDVQGLSSSYDEYLVD